MIFNQMTILSGSNLHPSYASEYYTARPWLVWDKKGTCPIGKNPKVKEIDFFKEKFHDSRFHNFLRGLPEMFLFSLQLALGNGRA